MFTSNSILSCLLLTFGGLRASALNRRDAERATFKLSREINSVGFSSLPEKDRARAQALAQHSILSERSAGGSVSAANAAVFFTAEVGVGTPPTHYTLLVDTRSSITWVGANKSYTTTNSSVNTGGFVYGLYGSGVFFGEEWLDTVAFAPDLAIHQQSIGIANWTYGIDNIDGILGLGPINLTLASNTNSLRVPTITDNLYSQGKISEEVLGIFFPPASESDSNGTLTFGGYDDSVLTGSVNYVPLTTTFPASQFWGINQSISYGGVTILTSTAGIVDTGTTLILIATEAFKQYQSLTGAVLDPTTGLLTITSSQYSKLQTLSFQVGGVSYDLIPNAQIWPRTLNSMIGGNSRSIYLIVSDIGFPDGLYFDFVNGYCFLERYYSIFDTGHLRFGLAETIYTHSNKN